MGEGYPVEDEAAGVPIVMTPDMVAEMKRVIISAEKALVATRQALDFVQVKADAFDALVTLLTGRSHSNVQRRQSPSEAFYLRQFLETVEAVEHEVREERAGLAAAQQQVSGDSPEDLVRREAV